MNAQTFQNKYRIEVGTTWLQRQMQVYLPLHYHVSDGYSHDVIRHHSTDKELRQTAELIVYLNDAAGDVDEVMDDLRRLKQTLHDPYMKI